MSGFTKKEVTQNLNFSVSSGVENVSRELAKMGDNARRLMEALDKEIQATLEHNREEHAKFLTNALQTEVLQQITADDSKELKNAQKPAGLGENNPIPQEDINRAAKLLVDNLIKPVLEDTAEKKVDFKEQLQGQLRTKRGDTTSTLQQTGFIRGPGK